MPRAPPRGVFVCPRESRRREETDGRSEMLREGLVRPRPAEIAGPACPQRAVGRVALGLRLEDGPRAGRALRGDAARCRRPRGGVGRSYLRSFPDRSWLFSGGRG